MGDTDSMQPNLYRDGLADHAADVSREITYTLTPPSGFGSPCTAACQSVAAGAGESPAADTGVEGLDALGRSIKMCFENYLDDVEYEYSLEDAEVDVHGADAWKATWEKPASYLPRGASLA